MSTNANSSVAVRWLLTLTLGAVMGVVIWLAGAHEVAFLGFVIAALAREPRYAHACRPRLTRRST